MTYNENDGGRRQSDTSRCIKQNHNCSVWKVLLVHVLYDPLRSVQKKANKCV